MLMLPKSASVLNTQQHRVAVGGQGVGQQLDEEFTSWRVRARHALCGPTLPLAGPTHLVLLLLLQAKHPCILQHFNTFLERVNGKRVAVFLDYDGTFTQPGWCWCSCTCKPPPHRRSQLIRPFLLILSAGTLTPIVNNPDQAIMSPQVCRPPSPAKQNEAECWRAVSYCMPARTGLDSGSTHWPFQFAAVCCSEVQGAADQHSRPPYSTYPPCSHVPLPMLQMRDTVRQVAHLFPTAIISGRGRDKVEAFVQLPELFYAGSHGMDIAGPQVSTSSWLEGAAVHMQLCVKQLQTVCAANIARHSSCSLSCRDHLLVCVTC
jgi:hypothetical protein